jgi:hypothetical protein
VTCGGKGKTNGCVTSCSLCISNPKTQPLVSGRVLLLLQENGTCLDHCPDGPWGGRATSALLSKTVMAL